MIDQRLQLEALYRLCRRELYACAFAVTRSREKAEDAVHNAFERLTRRDVAADDLKAYVFRAVRNAAIDQLRGVKSHQPLDADMFVDPNPGPAAQAISGEFGTRAAAALEQLSDDERETIIQHLWGGQSLREIARLRDLPPGSVFSWYRRGLARMRELMKE